MVNPTGMIYLGTVTGIRGAKLMVQIPAIGGSDPFGPMKAAVVPTGEEYAKGDDVIVGQYGLVRENLVVLGKVQV